MRTRRTSGCKARDASATRRTIRYVEEGGRAQRSSTRECRVTRRVRLRRRLRCEGAKTGRRRRTKQYVEEGGRAQRSSTRECRVTRRVRLRRRLRCEAREGRPTQAYKTVRRGGRPSATKQMSRMRSRTSP